MDAGTTMHPAMRTDEQHGPDGLVRTPEGLDDDRAEEDAERARLRPTISRRRMRFMRPVADLIDDGLGGIDTRSPWFAVVAPFYPTSTLTAGMVRRYWPGTGDAAKETRQPSEGWSGGGDVARPARLELTTFRSAT